MHQVDYAATVATVQTQADAGSTQVEQFFCFLVSRQADILDENKKLISAVDYYFLQEDGGRFKVTVLEKAWNSVLSICYGQASPDPTLSSLPPPLSSTNPKKCPLEA